MKSQTTNVITFTETLDELYVDATARAPHPTTQHVTHTD